MKKAFYMILIGAVTLTAAGCQNSQSRAPEGAVIGGLLGAAAGGIIGHQSGRGGQGAGIGAAAGILTGAIVGSQIKKPPAAGQAPQPGSTSAPSPNQMSMQQIVDLSKQGIADAVIIDKIKLTNSRFNLSPDDVNYLKGQGVSQNVISVMQGS